MEDNSKKDVVSTSAGVSKKRFDRKAFATGENRIVEDTKRKQTQFPIKKPGGKNFFRVCPDSGSRAYGVNTVEGTMGKIHVVSEEVVQQSEDIAARVKSQNLFTCVTHNGDYFIWHIPNDFASSWSQSALKAVAVAEKHWLRLHANGFAQGYDQEVVSAVKYPLLAAKEPDWFPSGSEILDTAMEDAAITDMNDGFLQEILKGLK
jgi:hypothetical protein